MTRLGVRVVNAPRAMEACVDKSMTSFLVARAGLPTPETWTLESFEQARALVRREIEGGPLVLKPLFGAQGKGLRLIRAVDDLPPLRKSRAYTTCNGSNLSKAKTSETFGYSSSATVSLRP